MKLLRDSDQSGSRAVNNGPYAATAVRLTTTLPTGLTNVSAIPNRGNCTAAASITCDMAVLRVGEAMNVVVQYTPPTVMAIPVSASIEAHESDGAPGNNEVDANAQTDGDFANLRVTLQPSTTLGGSWRQSHLFGHRDQR